VLKLHFCLYLRRNHPVSMEKRTSKVISRKIRGSRKPRAPRRAKRRKTRQDAEGQQAARLCTQDPARSAGQRSGRAWPCWLARPCHLARPYQVGCQRGEGLAIFRPFKFGFPSILETPLSTLLRAYFRVELGLSLGLNKLH